MLHSRNSTLASTLKPCKVFPESHYFLQGDQFESKGPKLTQIDGSNEKKGLTRPQNHAENETLRRWTRRRQIEGGISEKESEG